MALHSSALTLSCSRPALSNPDFCRSPCTQPAAVVLTPAYHYYHWSDNHAAADCETILRWIWRPTVEVDNGNASEKHLHFVTPVCASQPTTNAEQRHKMLRTRFQPVPKVAQASAAPAHTAPRSIFSTKSFACPLFHLKANAIWLTSAMTCAGEYSGCVCAQWSSSDSGR